MAGGENGPSRSRRRSARGRRSRRRCACRWRGARARCGRRRPGIIDRVGDEISVARMFSGLPTEMQITAERDHAPVARPGRPARVPHRPSHPRSRPARSVRRSCRCRPADQRVFAAVTYALPDRRSCRRGQATRCRGPGRRCRRRRRSGKSRGCRGGCRTYVQLVLAGCGRGGGDDDLRHACDARRHRAHDSVETYTARPPGTYTPARCSGRTRWTTPSHAYDAGSCSGETPPRVRWRYRARKQLAVDNDVARHRVRISAGAIETLSKRAICSAAKASPRARMPAIMASATRNASSPASLRRSSRARRAASAQARGFGAMAFLLSRCAR